MERSIVLFIMKKYLALVGFACLCFFGASAQQENNFPYKNTIRATYSRKMKLDSVSYGAILEGHDDLKILILGNDTKLLKAYIPRRIGSEFIEKRRMVCLGQKIVFKKINYFVRDPMISVELKDERIYNIPLIPGYNVIKIRGPKKDKPMRVNYKSKRIWRIPSCGR